LKIKANDNDKGCIAGKNCLGILKYSFSLEGQSLANRLIRQKPTRRGYYLT